MNGLKPMVITGQLKIRGMLHRDAAARLGVERSTVTHTIRGRRRSHTVRQGIADLIEMPYEVVWGEESVKVGTCESVNVGGGESVKVGTGEGVKVRTMRDLALWRQWIGKRVVATRDTGVRTEGVLVGVPLDEESRQGFTVSLRVDGRRSLWRYPYWEVRLELVEVGWDQVDPASPVTTPGRAGGNS